jgi:hypothetical protein
VYNLGVSLIIAVVFLFLGGLAVFWMAPELTREAGHIESLPWVDASDFTRLASEEELCTTGALHGTPLHSDLVLYAYEEWVVESDGDGGYDGEWEAIEYNIPALSVAHDDGHIPTVPVASATLGGEQREVILERGTGRRVDGYTAGTRRVAGYYAGDRVSVVGRKDPAGRLVPERFYGGERDALVKDLRLGSRLAILIGVSFMFVGPVVFILGLFGKGNASVSVG